MNDDYKDFDLRKLDGEGWKCCLGAVGFLFMLYVAVCIFG